MSDIRQLTADEFCGCGVALANRHRTAAAIVCFQRAVDLDPQSAAAWYFLGKTYYDDGCYSLAEDALYRSRRLDPAFPGAPHQLGTLFGDLGKFDEAMRWYDEALRLKPNAPDILLDRALTLLMAGRWKEGFDGYEARLKHLPQLYPKTDLPLWQGEPLINKNLYVYADQGIGDIIMFSRYLSWVGGLPEHVLFDVPAEVLPLFKTWKLATLRLHQRNTPLTVKPDCWIPLSSLPRMFGTTADTVPPDHGMFRDWIDPSLVDFPKPPDSVLKVGICWSGNPMHGQDRSRSIALEHFLPLAANPRIQLYSFQVGHRAGDIKLVGADPLIYDLGSQLTDWVATAAALRHMDLIISVDTAVAHLAGALDIPVWLLLPEVADWRWLTRRSDTPWYPHMRLIRRQRQSDWKGVLQVVAQQLKDHTADRERRRVTRP